MSEGKLNLVTTNGHTLSAYTEDFVGFSDNQRIIPYEAVLAISKLDSKRTALFRFYDDKTVVHCGDTKIIASLVELISLGYAAKRIQAELSYIKTLTPKEKQ
jgi:DNA polymerase III sliding clamp (beta) subunit (PCNA family)